MFVTSITGPCGSVSRNCNGNAFTGVRLQVRRQPVSVAPT